MPETATPLQKQEAALKEQAGRLRAQAKVQTVDPAAAKKAQKIIRQMQRETKKMQVYEGATVDKPSDLQWTKWSQQQKSREVQAKELLNKLPQNKAEQAQKILTKMQEETEKMWSMRTRRPGTPGYYKSQERMRKLYARLEKLGLVSRSGDIIAGDVGYH